MAIFAVARLDCIRRIDFCAALLSPHGYRRTRVPSLEADLENSVIAPNQSLHQSTGVASDWVWFLEAGSNQLRSLPCGNVLARSAYHCHLDCVHERNALHSQRFLFRLFSERGSASPSAQPASHPRSSVTCCFCSVRANSMDFGESTVSRLPKTTHEKAGFCRPAQDSRTRKKGQSNES